MSSDRRAKVWYRKWWGIIIALCIWPFFLIWIVWTKSGNKLSTKLVGSVGVLMLLVISFIALGSTLSQSSTPHTDTPQKVSTTSSTSKTTVSTATKNTAPTKSQTSKPSQPTQPAAPILTAFGALRTNWDAHHTADKRYADGSSYNPNPALSEDGSSSFDDQYYTINWIGGRAINYQMRFLHQQPTAVTKTAVMQEFPADTTVLWEQAETSDPTNACYAFEISSPTLARALNDSGDVMVELFTEPTPDSSYNSYYNPSNVTNALLDGFTENKTAADFSGC